MNSSLTYHDYHLEDKVLSEVEGKVMSGSSVLAPERRDAPYKLGIGGTKVARRLPDKQGMKSRLIQVFDTLSI